MSDDRHEGARPAGARRALLAVAVAALGACAESPTVIVTDVAVAAGTPPLLLLRITVANVASGRDTSSSMRSQGIGDAEDRPSPFLFPMRVPVGVHESLAGPVTVTIEGLDWDSYAVIAQGSTSAEVVPRQRTTAALTLSAVPVAGGS